MSLVENILYPFQREDVNYLVDRKGVLIANEMGTGKTLEALALDLQRREIVKDFAPKTLIICPLTVTSVWLDHVKRLTPLHACGIDPKNRGEFVAALKKPYDVYVIHWEAMRLLQTVLRETWWFHIIADEVHRAKNRRAQQTRALKSLRSTYKTGLSGTPATNKPYDLWSILNWLYSSQFKSYWKFYDKYCDYEIVYPNGYHKFKGTKNADELHLQIQPYYIRRKKMEVLKDLPEKYYSQIWVDLSPKQRKAYDEMKKEMIAWLESQTDEKPLVAPVVIAQLIRLQQFSVAYADISPDGRVVLTEPSTKLDALMELIEDNEEDQFVVFSQFKQLINLASARLQTACIPFVTITGDVAQADRSDAVAKFQAGEARVFLGTIGAGGEGITLTAASTVVFLDRDWSPARNSQAEDRLHRIGQKSAVQVIDINANRTVDQRKHTQLELKASWLREILDPK